MGTERLSMRKIQEILRQKWVLGCSHRAVAQALGVSLGAVTETVRRATAAGLDWVQVAPATDAELEQRLYRRPAGRGSLRPQPECAYLHTERRKPFRSQRVLVALISPGFPSAPKRKSCRTTEM